MYGDYILAQCPDYFTGTTALETIVESGGHIVIVGVACHIPNSQVKALSPRSVCQNATSIDTTIVLPKI
jgi:hypothetical protein